jgi:hypothetical protein
MMMISSGGEGRRRRRRRKHGVSALSRLNNRGVPMGICGLVVKTPAR